MIKNGFIKGIAMSAAIPALWEMGLRWYESIGSRNGYEHWRGYYDQKILKRADNIREIHSIRSTGVNLHIDVYPNADKKAPVIVFNHGGAGYCRLFIDVALMFYDRGYTVVLPDQRGQGLSGGRRGDFTVAECAQNILDVSRWAKTRYKTPVYLFGGSMGGGLAYYAASAGAPVNAIACLNLLDFGNAIDGIGFSRFSLDTHIEKVARLAILALALLKPLHWLRIPYRWIGAFDKLMDSRDLEFQNKWDADPIPNRVVSIGQLYSSLQTSAPVPFEKNTIPVLVINQANDEMVDPETTRRNYERLNGPKKYLEIPFGHWSSKPDFWEPIIDTCNKWFASNTKAK